MTPTPASPEPAHDAPRQEHGEHSEHEEHITPEAKAKAVKTRRVILAVLAVVAVATVGLAVTWNRDGQWTPRWSADDGAVCPVQIMAPAAPDDTTVNVYNGTDRQGVAQEAAESLQRRGYRVNTVGNGQAQDDSPTSVGVIVTGPKTVAQALSLQRQVPQARVQIQPRRSDGQVDLLLDQGYAGLATRPNLGPGRIQCTQLVFAG